MTFGQFYMLCWFICFYAISVGGPDRKADDYRQTWGEAILLVFGALLWPVILAVWMRDLKEPKSK